MIENVVKIREDDALRLYNEFLDSCHDNITVCGCVFDPSYALKELDETAYRTGFNDWLDAEEMEIE